MVKHSGHLITILSIAMEKIADNVMITDIAGVIEYVNPAFEVTTGFSSQEAVGQTPRILRSGQHGPQYYRELWRTILSGHVFRATTTNKKKNGDIYYADQTVSPVLDKNGEIICFVSIWKDITDRIRAEEQIKYEKNKLEQVLGIEASLHSILELNNLLDFVVEKICEVLEAERCTIMFIDNESGELCIKGHRGIEEATIGQKILKIGHNMDELIAHHHNSQGAVKNDSVKIDGKIYKSELFLSVPIELKGNLLGIINVSHKKGKHSNVFNELDLKILLMVVRQVRIAIENARLYRELNYLSVTDPLTGLYNFRYLSQVLDSELIRAERYQRKFSFLMIDVDQFKSYNDLYGHWEGDRCLKAVAKVLKENARATDIVCRYAGDEFAIVLPETDLVQAKDLSERIRKKVSELSLKEPVSVTIGVAESRDKINRHDMIRRADSHLLAAKKEGRNQISG